jgi:regulator of protease activity HflC (stomatin/prohibitin superfamily)
VKKCNVQIDERITTRLQESGIEVTDFLVRDINFSAEFIASIEAKQVEEQALQRAVTEAQRRRTEAQGLADADIERARGVAESRLIEARAEAEALRLISQQIAANPSLIQYTYIQNLSDNVSIALVPSNSPFLFDFESLADPDANFTAPDVPDVSVDDITGEDGETSSGN